MRVKLYTPNPANGFKMPVILQDLNIKKNKPLLFVLGVTFILHLVVLTFQIRNWPLTDYPMFSKAYDKFSKIETIYIYSIYPDHEYKWTRREIGETSSYERNLNLYFINADTTMADNFVIQKAYSKFSHNLPQKIEIRKMISYPFRKPIEFEQVKVKELILNE